MSKIVIDALTHDSKTGFQPGVIYCFNHNLKGILCDYCKVQAKCKGEENGRKKENKTFF